MSDEWGDDTPFDPMPDLPDRLRSRTCPAGLPHTGDDPASDHGHTDCWYFHLAADEIDRLRAIIAALLAIPDEWDALSMEDALVLDPIADLRRRMAAVVEGERGFHDAAPTEPEVGSRWLPKADLTAKPRTVSAVGWSIDKVWRVWWVGPDGKHGAAPELDLFLDGHVRMAAVLAEGEPT